MSLRILPLRRARGSVLLLVLVTVMLMAFLLAKFVQRAGTELLADARAGDQARLRREAYSALEVTLAVLADFRANDQGLHSPAQGWDQPLEYAGYTPAGRLTAAVDIEDESGKISLPRADAATLEVLLESLGLRRTDAERVADALLVWTRADHVSNFPEADAGNYERGALPHQPARRPLRSFAELAAVAYARDFFVDEDGQPTPLAQEFAASVSLYSFDRMNINAAPPLGLAVGGLAGGQIDALRDFTQSRQADGRQNFFRAPGEAAALLGSVPLQSFGAEAAVLGITVTIRDGAAAYRLRAIVAPPGGAVLAQAAPPEGEAKAAAAEETGAEAINKLDYPFTVLEIRENLESTDPESTDPASAESPGND